jgi:hypothetical protein
MVAPRLDESRRRCRNKAHVQSLHRVRKGGVFGRPASGSSQSSFGKSSAYRMPRSASRGGYRRHVSRAPEGLYRAKRKLLRDRTGGVTVDVGSDRSLPWYTQGRGRTTSWKSRGKAVQPDGEVFRTERLAG